MSAQPAPNYEDAVRAALESRIEQGSLELPLLPAGVAQILELCRSSNSSAAELSSAIHKDPALAGHVLRVANSPAYSPGSPIVSLQQAIGRLGQRAISEIAISVSVKSAIFDVGAYRVEMAQLWKHAAAAGAWAREIARQRRRPVDAALLCGLLQNMGVPVLVRALSKIEKELHGDLGKSAVLALADEYHAAVSSRLAKQWSLPEAVSEAILYHHDYASAPSKGDEARLIALSDHLARLLLDGAAVQPAGGASLRVVESPRDDGADVDRWADHPAYADLNLYPDDVEALVAKRDDVIQFVETLR